MQAAMAHPKSLRWFGSSGIRGPLAELDVSLALRVGQAIGATHQRVIVGRDARLTGPALEAALVAGLLSSGASVTRAGVCPTPALARAARDHDLGVQVTASHNPAPDNGIKLWNPDGAAPTMESLLYVETGIAAPPAPAPWDGCGTLHGDRDILSGYQADVLAHVRGDGGPRPLEGHRIALDCAHGAGALATPSLLSALGAETTVLGGAPDGRFPDHPSEPSPENLTHLSRLVAGGGFLIGIAHDGDADRTIILDGDGKVIPQERLFAVLAAARGDKTVAVPVDASSVIGDHLPGLEIRITPVGDPYVSRAVAEGATFACEPSGTWFFREWSPTPEGPFAAAAIAAQIARAPRLLDEVRALPRYERRSRKVPLSVGTDRAGARAKVETAGHALTTELSPRRVSNADGVRLDTDDGWLLLRGSGTEPIIRVTAEAKHAARAETLVTLGEKTLIDALGAR